MAGIGVSRLPGLVIITSLVFLALLLTSCASSDEETVNKKVSSQLLTQVNLRKEQLASPTPDRLEMMRNMGMNVNNLEMQRLFIHLVRELAQSQIAELTAMGITLYTDSWLPPVGDHPTGFLMADMPVNRLADLAKKSYVVRLETAERQLQPQNTAGPQSE